MTRQLELGLVWPQEGITQSGPFASAAIPLHEKPSERMRHVGERGLALRELLSLVIGSGEAKEIALVLAERLLAMVGSLPELNRASVAQMKPVSAPRWGG